MYLRQGLREEKAGGLIDKIRQTPNYAGLRRYRYDNNGYSIEDALKLVETIGKRRTPDFVIDGKNRFVYENFVKWCHCDPTMKRIHPKSREIIPGDLYAGIYIGGKTGTGKTWSLEVMKEYISLHSFRITLRPGRNDEDTRQMSWRFIRSDEICENFASDGFLRELKAIPLLALDDVGSEPENAVYMGNRIDVIRQLIESRCDRDDRITIITSNFRLGGWKLMERYGDRVVSRLSRFNYLEMGDSDRREI